MKLAHADFAYNRSPTFAIGHSPFEVFYGVNPYLPLNIILLPKEELVHTDFEAKLKSMMKLHEQIHKRIETVNATYKDNSNKNKKPRIFVDGDLVWVHLKRKRFPSKRKNTLMPRVGGSYKVVGRVNDNAYKVDLPSDYGVHAIFNIGDLLLYVDDDELAELRIIPLKRGGNDGNANHKIS